MALRIWWWDFPRRNSWLICLPCSGHTAGGGFLSLSFTHSGNGPLELLDNTIYSWNAIRIHNSYQWSRWECLQQQTFSEFLRGQDGGSPHQHDLIQQKGSEDIFWNSISPTNFATTSKLLNLPKIQYSRLQDRVNVRLVMLTILINAYKNTVQSGIEQVPHKCQLIVLPVFTITTPPLFLFTSSGPGSILVQRI